MTDDEKERSEAYQKYIRAGFPQKRILAKETGIDSK